MVSVEEDDLAGLEDVSSDGEDDNYEAELTDGDSNSTGTGTTTARRPYKKKARTDSTEPLPLMEGEGKAFRVLGFNQNQRAAFVQILMRFGVGDFDWKEFTSRMKQKTYEEIKDYGTLFLSHIAEDITESSTFTDGVPKDGLRIQDVLVRIAVLLLIRDKVKFASQHPQTSLFSDDILSRYPGLKGAKIWKEDHDLVLLRSVLKHGYGRWQAIVDDKDLKIQEVICQELNLPFINLPVPGQVGSQAQNGTNLTNAEVPNSQSRENGGSDIPADGAQGSGDARNQAQLYQDSSILYHFRDMQRRQVEFIKKRVLLLEKGLNAEYQKEYFGDPKSNDELKSESKAPKLRENESQIIDQLPQVETIASEEISAVCDSDPNRLELVRLYNEMCKVVEENPMDLVQTSLARNPAELHVGKNFPPLETICKDINRILTPTQEQSAADIPKSNSDNKSEAMSDGEILVAKSLPKPQDAGKPEDSANNGSKDMIIESEPIKASCSSLVKDKNEIQTFPDKEKSNTEMDETMTDAQ